MIIKVIPKLEILFNSSNFLIEKKYNEKDNLGILPMYKNTTSNESWIITINKLLMDISTYNNPQIRNSFSLNNLNWIKEANGVMINTLDRKHCELSTLYSEEPVHNEDIPFRTQNCEFFIDSTNKQPVQKNYAIKGFQTGIPINQDVSNIATVI